MFSSLPQVAATIYAYDYEALTKNMKRPCNHCGYRVSSWSCWADSNRRPHPYQPEFETFYDFFR